MRLAKSFKLMFGIAISTVMGMLLSGGAFAADGGESTTSQLINDSQVVQSSQSDSAVIENSKSVNHTGAVTTVSGVGRSGSSAGISPVVGTVSRTTVGVLTPDLTQVAKSGTSASLAASPLQKDLSVTPVIISDTPSDQGIVTAQVAEAASSDRDSIGQDVATGQTVVYHSTRLAIQPKITSTAIQSYDLASTIPSAPAQRQNPSSPPTPTTSDSLLGSLTARLAGSVVPALFHTPNLNLSGLAIVFLLLAATLYLAAGLNVDSFGSWTRRGGFAHAARSDVPSAIVNTFFATPLRLGYVSAFSPQHSPNLLVSDIKTVLSMVPNAYRKEEMR